MGSPRSSRCPFAPAIRTGRSRQDSPSGAGSAGEDGPQPATPTTNSSLISMPSENSTVRNVLIDWKTTTSRYSEEPAGLLSLDPQMICYSWISGIPDVAVVVFVRKSVPEIQYLKASITDEQRREYGRLVEATVGQIQSGQFPLAQRHPFPAKRMCELLSSGTLPRSSRTGRREPNPKARSKRP